MLSGSTTLLNEPQCDLRTMMQPARFWARSLVLLACLALFLPGGLMAADIVDLQATQKQLKELKSRMSKLEQRLNTARGEQGKLQAELARTERRISNLLGEIRDLERKITQSRQQLAELQSQIGRASCRERV